MTKEDFWNLPLGDKVVYDNKVWRVSHKHIDDRNYRLGIRRYKKEFWPSSEEDYEKITPFVDHWIEWRESPPQTGDVYIRTFDPGKWFDIIEIEKIEKNKLFLRCKEVFIPPEKDDDGFFTQEDEIETFVEDIQEGIITLKYRKTSTPRPQR